MSIALPFMRWILALLLAATAAAATANENAEPDPAKSQYWTPIRQMMFGDREILDGKDVIHVYLNTRAIDATTVPLSVKAQFDQTSERYIKLLYLIVERNPSPAAGLFHFTPDSGRAQLETRLRFEDFSFVRAIAETNDGKLYMSTRWVKAAGGCSAPGERNRIPPHLVGQMRFKFVEESLEYNKPALVQLMIRHPNESALASDFDETKVPRFVRSVKVTFDGKPVMSGEVDFSISDNPSFRFFFKPPHEGQLEAIVEDTHDQQYVHRMTITEGTPLPGG
ncbi:MAG: quinoprotein dehydrogenase-associated SoxYZ-like carrier [Betaproteobacteria bacterium]|nr:quinoprotein dehydrogenase-associated SoxYZ-like carrier [Betaproteobacteria bacterium]